MDFVVIMKFSGVRGADEVHDHDEVHRGSTDRWIGRSVVAPAGAAAGSMSATPVRARLDLEGRRGCRGYPAVRETTRR